MKRKIKPRLLKPKPRPVAIRPGKPAYTVATLRQKKPAELVIIAKMLAAEHKRATDENKEALGKLIIFIRDLLAEKEERNAKHKVGR